jgi:DDE superfamily endonuclease
VCKIIFPTHENDLYILSVDGTHCSINEPRAGTGFNKAYFSHKLHGPALSYEIGISIHSSNLVWVNGPFPASTNDDTIFQSALKHVIPPGKKAITDSGYHGDKVTHTNRCCDEATKLLIRRARQRHEKVNSRLKIFACLNQAFIHKLPLHKSVFEAVCVIVQYQMENGSPLYDV